MGVVIYTILYILYFKGAFVPETNVFVLAIVSLTHYENV